MTIGLELGSQPPSGKFYPLLPDELNLPKEYLDEIRNNGKIRVSNNSAGTPISFVKQVNGKLQIVVDCRALNAITSKDQYSLPPMTTLMEQVGTSQIFSKLHSKHSFNLLRIARMRIENSVQNSVRAVRAYGYAIWINQRTFCLSVTPS